MTRSLTLFKEQPLLEPVLKAEKAAVRVPQFYTVSDTDTTAQKADTTQIGIGKGQMIVTHDSNKKQIALRWGEDDFQKERKDIERPDIKVNLFRLDLGINSWLYDHSFNLPKEVNEFELEQAKSIHVGLHFFPSRLNLYKHKVHLFTSVGLNIPNYRIDRNVVFSQNSDSLFLHQRNTEFRRNKLAMTYLRVPLLIGFNTDPEEPNKAFRFRAGGFGSLLLTARNKQVSEEEGKVKRRDRFNLNRFQYGVTARIGFRFLEFYANYALNPLFAPNEGPQELRGLEMGIRIIQI
jgi:hypothetical protein